MQSANTNQVESNGNQYNLFYFCPPYQLPNEQVLHENWVHRFWYQTSHFQQAAFQNHCFTNPILNMKAEQVFSESINSINEAESKNQLWLSEGFKKQIIESPQENIVKQEIDQLPQYIQPQNTLKIIQNDKFNQALNKRIDCLLSMLLRQRQKQTIQKNEPIINSPEYIIDASQIRLLREQVSKKGKKIKNNDNDRFAELRIHKKHLTKLWTTKFMSFLKRNYRFKYCIPQDEIQYAKKLSSGSTMSYIQFSQLLVNSPNICRMIREEELIEDKPLEQIYRSSIQLKSKILMIETYKIFKQGITDPSRFFSWDSFKNEKKYETEELVNKCVGKTHKQIKEIMEVQKRQLFILNNYKKCSDKNNITYAWSAYLSEVIKEFKFRMLDPKNQLSATILRLLKKKSIENLKEALGMSILKDYIIVQKITPDRLIMEIISSKHLNFLNKYNLIGSYEAFKNGVYNPNSLKHWN